MAPAAVEVMPLPSDRVARTTKLPQGISSPAPGPTAVVSPMGHGLVRMSDGSAPGMEHFALVRRGHPPGTSIAWVVVDGPHDVVGVYAAG